MSETAICNMALILIGSQTINTLSDDSKTARVCSVFYETLRDEVLEAHYWGFARRKVSLAVSVTPIDEYDYGYQLPSDCIRIEKLSDTTAEYVVYTDGLYTNLEDAILTYTKRITDTDKFSAMFKSALSARIAASLATALKADLKTSDGMLNQYAALLEQARNSDARQVLKDIRTTNPFVDARS